MGILELLLKITSDSSGARADLERLRAAQSGLVSTLTGSLAAGLNASSTSFSRTTQQTEAGAKTTERYTTRVRSAEAAQRELMRTQQQAAVQALQLGVAQARAASQLNNLAQAQQRATQRSFINHLRQGNQAALQLGQGLKGLGQTLSLLVTAPIVAAGIGIVRAATQMDSLRRGLLAVEGSSAAVEKRLVILKEVAKLPGIGFKEAIQGQIRLEAVGFAADGATRTLRAFAKAVALTGGGKEELDRITVQLGQIAAKGKLMAQDLRPILEASPAVAQAVRAAFGTIDTEAIQKLHLTSEQLFAKLLPELEKLPVVTGGAKVGFENLEDSLFRLSATIGEAVLPPLMQVLEVITDFAESAGAAFQSLSAPVQQAIIIFAALVAALGPIIFIIGSIITSVAGFVGVIISAAAAVGGFTALASVLGVALLAIIGIFIQMVPTIAAVGVGIAAFYVLWQRNVGGIRELVFSAFTAIRAFLIQVWNEISALYQRVLPDIQATIRSFTSSVQAFWKEHGAFIVAVIQQAWEIIKTVVITTIRVVGDVISLFLRVFRGDWAGAWDAALNILSSVLVGWARFGITFNAIVASLLVRVITQIYIWAQQLYTAAIVAAVRLMDGFVYYTQGPGLNRALAAVLAIAYALSSPSVLAAYAAAGAAAAKARTDAYERMAAGQGASQGVGDLRRAEGAEAAAAAGAQTPPPAPLFRPGFGQGAGTGAGGKKGRKAKEDHTARENAEAADQIAQTELATAERTYSEEVAAAERAYQRRYVALEAYVARAKTAEQSRLDAALAAINTERAQVDDREKNEQKRAARRAALDEREKAARAEFNKNIQGLDDKAADVQLDSLRSHRESLLNQAAAIDQRRVDAYKAAADRRSISAEASERKIADIERAALDRRQTALEGDLALAGQDTAARQAINDQLAELAEERAGFEEEAARRITAARDADLQRAKQAARDLKALQEDAEADALRVGALDIERMQRERANSDEIARARRDQAIIAAELERRQALRRLTEEKDEALERVKGLANELELKQQINDLYRERELLATEEFNRRKKEIEDKYKHEKEDDDSILGPIDEEIGKIGDFGDAAQVLGQSIANTFRGIRDAVGESISAWVLYGKTQGAILRKVLAEQLAALAKEAAMQGLKQTALALAALAIGNFGAAARHGLSAAAWYALAGGSAALGRKVAGDLFNQSGGASGGTNTGAGGAGGGTGSGTDERRIIEQGRNQLQQVIILRVESNDSHIIGVVNRDIGLNGSTRDAIVKVVEG